MKKILIYFILLFLLIINVNGQKETLVQKDTVEFYDREGECEYTIIMKKDKYTIDILYADIDQKVKVEASFKRYFLTDSSIRFIDAGGPLVSLEFYYVVITYLDDRCRWISLSPGMLMEEEYQKITQPVIEKVYEKTKGEILHADGHSCYNPFSDELNFYVFPLDCKHEDKQR